MKRVLQSILSVITMVGLAIAVIWLVRGASGQQEMMAQATAQPIETEEVQVTVTPTPTPKIATTPTVETTSAPDNQNNSLEPTATSTPTPVIILPEGTSPPVPTPLPTPTSTPINPNEVLIATLPNATGNLVLSPDSLMLAFDQAESPYANTYTQLWKLEMASGKTAKLADYAYNPTWSPDGKKIVFMVRQGPVVSDVIEIKIIDGEGKEEQTIAKGSQILDYYWISVDTLGVINTNGFTVLDSTGKIKKQVNLKLPTTTISGLNKPKVEGYLDKFVVVGDGQGLLVTHSGETVTITDGSNESGRSISDFDLSPDGQRIAYIVTEGPSDELWVTDLKGKDKRLLYRAEHATVGFPTWSPDSKIILVGIRSKGTHLSDNLELILVYPEDEQLIRLNVDNVDRGFIWSFDGNAIIYARTITDQNNGTAQTNIYQLKVSP